MCLCVCVCVLCVVCFWLFLCVVCCCCVFVCVLCVFGCFCGCSWCSEVQVCVQLHMSRLQEGHSSMSSTKLIVPAPPPSRRLMTLKGSSATWNPKLFLRQLVALVSKKLRRSSMFTGVTAPCTPSSTDEVSSCIKCSSVPTICEPRVGCGKLVRKSSPWHSLRERRTIQARVAPTTTKMTCSTKLPVQQRRLAPALSKNCARPRRASLPQPTSRCTGTGSRLEEHRIMFTSPSWARSCIPS